MKPYEYIKYSYQNQLVGTYTLAFTSNKEKILCIVASAPYISLMYLLLGSFVSIQEVIRCSLHHYGAVKMGAISLTVVYATVYSDADQIGLGPEGSTMPHSVHSKK